MARSRMNFVRLEERETPAVFVVTTTIDDLAGGNANGSLRAAINTALLRADLP